MSTYPKLKLAVLILGSLSFLFKCLLAINTIGTNDMMSYQKFAEVAASSGTAFLYQAPVEEEFQIDGVPIRTQFNHPPFIALAMAWLHHLAHWLNMPFPTIYRIIVSLADAAALMIVWRMFVLGALQTTPAALCALALSPLGIMVAGFHGNTDTVMLFFLLLSMYSLQCMQSFLLCGLFLGMACDIKIAPLILIPALLLWLPTWRARLQCMAAFSLAFGLPFIPFTSVLPEVIHIIFGYASGDGVWGLTWIYRMLQLPAQAQFTIVLKYGMFAAIIVISIWMNSRGTRPSIPKQWGVIFALFLFLTPGFGIQYLLWLVPWVIVLGTRTTLFYYCSAGLFMFMTYTQWSDGIPWNFANAWRVGYHGWLNILQLLAWVTTFLVAQTFVWDMYLQNRAADPED